MVQYIFLSDDAQIELSIWSPEMAGRSSTPICLNLAPVPVRQSLPFCEKNLIPSSSGAGELKTPRYHRQIWRYGGRRKLSTIALLTSLQIAALSATARESRNRRAARTRTQSVCYPPSLFACRTSCTGGCASTTTRNFKRTQT